MARRFENVKVGDRLVHVQVWRGTTAGKPYERTELSKWVVTDVWFDPLQGRKMRASGEMVGVARIDHPTYKRAHTRRGLASSGFSYDPEQTAQPAIPNHHGNATVQ